MSRIEQRWADHGRGNHLNLARPRGSRGCSCRSSRDLLFRRQRQPQRAPLRPMENPFLVIAGNLFAGKRTSATVPLVVELRVRSNARRSNPSVSPVDRRQTVDTGTGRPSREFIQSFKDDPPSQKSGTFTLDTLMECSPRARQRGARPSPHSRRCHGRALGTASYDGSSSPGTLFRACSSVEMSTGFTR
jgi:hypothetical protein